MFGYVGASLPEMKLKEHELYKALYCGLCREMGRTTGCLSRLSLSYDFVFYAVIRMISRREFPKTEKFRCAVHPFKKRICACGSETLKEAAMLSALLSDEKLLDDISDGKHIKKALYSSLRPFSRHMVKKARRNGLSGEENIREPIKELYREEKTDRQSVDIYADRFGEALAEVFAFGESGDKKRILSEIGRYTGKFIYIADAIDDFADDRKNGSFNPIISLYGEEAAETVNGKIYLSSRIAESIKEAAMLNLREIALAYELLDKEENMLSALARNIIFFGMPEKLECIIKKATKEEKI